MTRLHRVAAQLSLALGLLIALAANLTYAVPRGPVVVGLGLVAPLVLPVVLYLRTTFSVTGFWPRLVREAATLLVAGPAAAVSYVHTYQLVLDAGELWLLAVLAPLSSDGLAGMATLALHRMHLAALMVSPPKATTKATQKQPPRRVEQPAPAAVATKPAPKAPKPVPVDLAKPERPALRSVPSDGDRDEKLAEIVAKGGGRGTVAKELGVTMPQARTILEKYKAATS